MQSTGNHDVRSKNPFMQYRRSLQLRPVDSGDIVLIGAVYLVKDMVLGFRKFASETGKHFYFADSVSEVWTILAE